MARVYVQRRELPEEFKRLFDALWSGAGTLRPETAAELTPAMDVIETSAGVEVLLDLPGVPADGLEIIFSGNVLMVAGQKLPPPRGHAGAAFHVAERGFGRFARALSVEGAFDAAAAAASLTHGELRIVLPRIEDRRGRAVSIPIDGD